MADTVFSLIGVGRLTATIAAVKHETSRKGGRFALRKAAALIANAVKQNAERLDDPETKEMIAKNITIRFGSKRFKQTGDLMFRVGVLGGARVTSPDAERSARRRRKKGIASLEDLGEFAGEGKGNPGGDTFYWRFIEFGTVYIPANPFMRQALESNIGAATAAFLTHYQKALDRAIKRAAKKG